MQRFLRNGTRNSGRQVPNQRRNPAVARKRDPGNEVSVAPHHGGTETADPGTFALADCDRYGFRFSPLMRTVMLFAGTTSGGVGAEIYRLAQREWGCMPAGFVPLFIDAALPPVGVPRNLCVTLGASGAGTVAARSLAEMKRHRSTIAHAVDAAVNRAMSATDAGLQIQIPSKQSMLGLIVGGAGGAGTPLTILAVDELIRAMEKLRVSQPRISIVHIGPEISAKDISRDPVQRQIPHIESNSAQLLEWLYQRTIVPMDQPQASPSAPGPQIARLAIIDQASATHSLATNVMLQHMLAHSLFFQLFSRAGRETSERETDHVGVNGFVTDID